MVAIEHCQKSSTITAASSDITTSSAAAAASSTSAVRSNSTTTTSTTVLSPTSSTNSTTSTASATITNTTKVQQQQQSQPQPQQKDKQKHSHFKILTNSSKKMSSASPSPSPPPPIAAQETKSTATTALSKSAVSQRNVDIKISKKSNKDGSTTTQELTKKVLKLDLTGKELDDFSLKSPKSPISARLTHQTSLTSSVDVEDRKTLREALYQGIFHRHRRTIFAVGSFLRMLRSRNSQYNTIRSSSEGEDIDEHR